jgi:putative Ig domain-containing protein/IPT/TIG domain-containing protein/SMP-30/gluconolaconase/LRE-like protein
MGRICVERLGPASARRWMLMVVLGAAAVMAARGILAPAASAATPSWLEVSGQAGPNGFLDSMAYDPATNQLVQLDNDGQTWTWDGASWTLQSLATNPSPRFSAPMAYDAATRQLILFGGDSVPGQLNDTWDWTGSNWVKLSPATSPPPVGAGTMAYDSATRRLILFGGQTPMGLSNATWSWDGTTWTQLSPAASPPARENAAMAYDPATSQMILFGGYNGTTVPAGDTWNWTGSNWTPLAPASPPAPRFLSGMAYDPDTAQLLLEDGEAGFNSAFNDQWAWTGSAWRRLSPPASVTPAVFGFSMAYDPAEPGIVLYGGTASSLTQPATTWLWAPLSVHTAALAAGTVGVPYSATLQAIAGKAPYTWSVTGGALPAGVSLSSAGKLSGTPSAAGAATFSVTVLDSTTPTVQRARRSLTLTINPPPPARVWVGNGANSDVNAFPLTATATTAPTGGLNGSLTGLNGVGALAFDPTGDLYVASTNTSAVEMFASGASGNVAPSRILSGPLTGIVTPHGLAFDANQRLYVTNTAASSVTVFAAGAHGNVAPVQTIAGPGTGLSAPWGVTIDKAGHIWVANEGGDANGVYSLTEYAATANGNQAPLASITSPQLSTPEGLAQDSAGNLLVANLFGHAVLRLTNRSPWGAETPSLTLSSGLRLPEAVDLDAGQNIYVADESSGLVIYRAGSSTPRVTLNAGVTDVKAPDAVAVSPPLSIAMRRLPEAAVGRAYSGRLLAILGRGSLHWRLARGRLPSGLRLSPAGRITGIPRRASRLRLDVSVRDAEHPAQTATAAVTLVIGRVPVITSMHPRHGRLRGDEMVRIAGRALRTAGQPTTVTFGRLRAARVSCSSATHCIAVSPPRGPGTVTVTVTVGGLGSASSKASRYTYGP